MRIAAVCDAEPGYPEIVMLITMAMGCVTVNTGNCDAGGTIEYWDL